MTPIFHALVQARLDQLYRIWTQVSAAGDPHGILPVVDIEIERWIAFRRRKDV